MRLRFSLRKTIKNSETELAPEKAFWLDVRTIARVEVTSEDWRYPIESAFDEIDERGWRAAERGKQNIRLFFDEPPRIRRIWLRFIELEAELLALTLLHEPYHGVHHQRAGLPHAELPQHVGALVPTTPGEQCPYRSYRHALLDLLRSLTDPRVGAQWRTSTPSRT